MNFILEIFKLILGGLNRMETKNEKGEFGRSDKENIANKIDESYKIIIEKEIQERNMISQKKNQMNEKIDEEREEFKEKMIKKMKEKEKKIKKIEVELEEAMKEDDLEKINEKTKLLEELMN